MHAPILSTLVGIASIFIGFVAVGSFHRAGPRLPVIPEDSPTKMLPPRIVEMAGLAVFEAARALARITTPPQIRVVEIIAAYAQSEVLYMLVHHGIVDDLGDRPRTSAQLAKDKDLQHHILHEFLEAGCHLGFLHKDRGTAVYSLTSSGALVQSNSKVSFRELVLHANQEHREAVRAGALQSIRTGRTGWKEAFGENEYDWLELHPEAAALFDRALKSMAMFAAGSVLADWTPPAVNAVLCDVGGGGGQLTAHFLEHYPEMSGIVFDLPSATARADELFRSKGLAGRARTVAGNFFDEPWPAADQLGRADVFFLMQILHNWDDRSCVQILQSIRRVAAKSGAKVVIVEQVLGTSGPWQEMTKSIMSTHMVTTLNAKERTLAEYKELLLAAGYMKKASLIPIRGLMSLIEIGV